jgi:hypothetical protein
MSIVTDHPQLEFSLQTGMKILDNLVEITPCSKVTEWLLRHMKSGKNAEAWKDMTENAFMCLLRDEDEEKTKKDLKISNSLWLYFDYTAMLLDDYNFGSARDCVDDTYVVLQHGDKYVLLNDFIQELKVEENKVSLLIENYKSDKIFVIRQL